MKKNKSFSLVDAKRVKAIEVATNHDVKAVEYYIRERLEKMKKKRMFPWIHFALTSEDINNLSYSLMWQDALKIQFIPVLHEVIKKLNSIDKQFSSTPMLSLTHGQSATPTTFGKQISVFVHRLKRQHDQIKKQNRIARTVHFVKQGLEIFSRARTSDYSRSCASKHQSTRPSNPLAGPTNNCSPASKYILSKGKIISSKSSHPSSSSIFQPM